MRKLLSGLLALGVLASAQGASAQVFPRTWQMWIGPNPFSSGAAVRSDFKKLWNEPNRWPLLRSNTEVVKLYLNMLQDPATTGGGGLSSADLAAFASQLNASGKKVAFEVGGLRNYAGTWCGASLGENTWAHEWSLLQRWIAAGGKIDYLTADHAIAMNYFDGTSGGCNTLSMDTLAGELGDYFLQATTQFQGQGLPVPKFGFIESLGYWSVSSSNGSFSPTASLSHNGVAVNPSIDIGTLLTKVSAATTARSVAIDHFDVDFGMEGVEYDQGYGRILGVEQAVHAKGWKVGIIANAWAKPGIDPNISVRDRTVNFLAGYFKTSASPDKLIFQQWQPNPDTLGDEADGTGATSLSLIFASVFHLSYPHWLPVGEYRTWATIFKVVNSSSYCQWNSWSSYLAAHGNNGDLSGLAGYGSRPYAMTYLGDC